MIIYRYYKLSVVTEGTSMCSLVLNNYFFVIWILTLPAGILFFAPFCLSGSNPVPVMFISQWNCPGPLYIDLAIKPRSRDPGRNTVTLSTYAEVLP